ncbi:hypothetical protein Tco_1088143 [Tanacetum coccineum]
METQKPLLKDENGEEVDIHMYRSIIGSLMYLTFSRPEIMFAVCAYARYQVNPKVSHLYAVKRIFRYLKAYTDSDYAGASLDMKSTTGGCQFLGCRLISWQCKKQTVVANSITEAEYVAASSCCGQLHVLVDGKKIIINESTVRRDLQLEDAEGIDYLPNSTISEQHALIGKPKRKDTQVPQPSGPTDIVADEAVYKELGDSLVKVATTAYSLEAEHDNGNITKTRSKETPNESSSLGTTSGGGLRCQETMGDTIAQTGFESVSKHSNDSLLARGNTLQSDEDRLKLNELMELCTNLQQRVLDLEKTKTTQANEIDSLKRRVKKLEKKDRLRTHKLKRLYKVGLSAMVESSRDEDSLGKDASKQGRRINAIDADEDITLVNVQDDADAEMFDVNAFTGDEVFAKQEVAAKDVNLTIDEVTLAQALAALKSVKPKVKGNVIEEPSVPVSVVNASTKVSAATTTTATIPTPRKGIIIIETYEAYEEESSNMLDEEIALKLQAVIDEEERIARDKEEKIDKANIA